MDIGFTVGIWALFNALIQEPSSAKTLRAAKKNLPRCSYVVPSGL